MAQTKKIQKVREQMISIYGEGCWMGYKLTKKNPYSYHHIKEARNGGRVSIDNGALLTRAAHDDLNLLDEHARSLYCELNNLFKELNQTRKPPTKEYFKEVNGVLLFADRIITLSPYCELNPDYEALEEFAQMTHECYPDIPEIKEEEKQIIYEEEETIRIPKHYKTKMKKKNRNVKRYRYC